MQARSKVFSLIYTMTLLFSTMLTTQAQEKQKQGVWDGKTHVVYHLSDPNQVNLALQNISFHLKGMGDAELMDIVLVVQGQALLAFHKKDAFENIQRGVAALIGKGVDVRACANTMAMQGITLDDLFDDLQVAERGAVIEVTNLQSDGYIYIRP